MKVQSKLVLTTSVLLLAAISSPADITLYSQAFTGGSGSDLNGTAVTGGTLAGNWIAGTAFNLDGTVVGTIPRTSAVLPFTPLAGNIYQLSADITITTTSTTWLGLGFADNVAFTGLDNNTNRFAGAAIPGYSWMFTSSTAQSYFQGGGAVNLATESAVDTAGSSFQVMIELDASNPNWATKYFLNNTLVASGAYIGTAPIDSVGMSTGNGNGTFSNFQLVLVEVVPEPSGAALFGLAGLVCLQRFRHR